MLDLPVGGTRFDGCAGVESLKGERFQFLGSRLIGADKTLQVGFNRKSLGHGPGADFRFELGMNGDISHFPSPAGDSRPSAGYFSSGNATRFLARFRSSLNPMSIRYGQIP